MKPILFNTEGVKGILEGRKNYTRRVIKPRYRDDECGFQILTHLDGRFERVEVIDDNEFATRWLAPPYRPGDILYVRETWSKKVSDGCKWHKSSVCPFESCETAHGPCFDEEYIYKATDNLPSYGGKWHPSIHMPKEAARLYLRVTSVRAERLQDITDEQALLEGVPDDAKYPLDNPVYCPVCKGAGLIATYNPVTFGFMVGECPHCDTPIKRFSYLWDSTVKKADLPFYGWAANPWVWVIEFERISKEEAEHGTLDKL